LRAPCCFYSRAHVWLEGNVHAASAAHADWTEPLTAVAAN